MEASPSCVMCGAPLAWSPGEATLRCPHCGTLNERTPPPSGPWGIEKADLPEHDLRTALDAPPPAEIEQTLTVACPGCGAEIEFEPGTLAENCPFCATPLARAPAHPHRHPKPGAVLPFALTEAEARAAMLRWLGTLWFAPNGLGRYAGAGRPLQGVYLPFYTYDARGEARYRGQRGDAYYVTAGFGKNRRRQRRIRWSSRSGEVRRDFDDVLVHASDRLQDRADDDALASWDLQALEPYSPRFLAGFRAELPSLELRDGWQRAREAMADHLRRDARRAIGGDEQRIDRFEAAFRDPTFKHVLLPVWLAAYRFRGKAYAVAVNGRTGKVAGERPWSPWKIAVAAALALVIAVALAWVWAGSR